MKVYVASSWHSRGVAQALRTAGHSVYDSRNPEPGARGFSWRECATEEQLRDPRRFRDEVLTSAPARSGFAQDMDALRAADATVLVLPCWRSAHLELGWAAGSGQQTVVLLDDPLFEPELMYLACSRICVSVAEVVEALSTGLVAQPPPRPAPPRLCDESECYDPRRYE